MKCRVCKTAEAELSPRNISKYDYVCGPCRRSEHRAVQQGKQRDYQRKYRAENREKYREWAREYQQRNREKSSARSTARRAVKAGKLPRKNCERCGEQQSQMHHDDYSKPLQVRWLCAPCHGATHRIEAVKEV